MNLLKRIDALESVTGEMGDEHPEAIWLLACHPDCKQEISGGRV